MSIAVGSAIPRAQLRRKTAAGVEAVDMEQFTRGRTVILFGVPGAFTGTCSETHLPGFVARRDDLKKAGVDEIACVAVNDPFVMEAWGKHTGAADHLVMLSDGNAEFAEAMDVVLDATRFGMGRRNRRFAAVVRNGVIDYLGVEEGREVGVSSAEAVLDFLGS